MIIPVISLFVSLSLRGSMSVISDNFWLFANRVSTKLFDDTLVLV